MDFQIIISEYERQTGCKIPLSKKLKAMTNVATGYAKHLNEEDINRNLLMDLRRTDKQEQFKKSLKSDCTIEKELIIDGHSILVCNNPRTGTITFIDETPIKRSHKVFLDYDRGYILYVTKSAVDGLQLTLQHYLDIDCENTITQFFPPNIDVATVVGNNVCYASLDEAGTNMYSIYNFITQEFERLRSPYVVEAQNQNGASFMLAKCINDYPICLSEERFPIY